MQPPSPQFAAGVAAGRREAVEQLAASLRKKIAAYRLEEARRGRLTSALLWSVTETWIGRLEGLAAELEQHVARLRMDEAGLEIARPKAPRPAAKKRARAR